MLVIEDNIDDEMTLMNMLEKAGMGSHVEVVRDGKRALDHLTQDEAKIENLIALFLDLNIPTINGLKLLAMIRADQRLAHLPVIAMTSANSPKDMKECQRLNVVSFVQKPLTLAKFTKAIADIFHLPNGTVRPLEKTGLVE